MSGNLVRFQSSNRELQLNDDIHDDLRESSADPYNKFNNSRTQTIQGRRRGKAENTEPKLPLNIETNDEEKSVNDGGNNESGTKGSEEDNVIKEGEASTSPKDNETENRSEGSGKVNESNNNDSEKKKVWKDIGKFALKTAAISGVILGGTAIALPLIGFGALGPVAGSLAAAYQSSVLGGTIASGSAFATLQSVGMVGLSAAAQATVVGGSAAASAAHTAYGKFKDKKETDEKDNGVKNNEKKDKKEEDSREKDYNKEKENDNEEKENKEKKDNKDSEFKKDSEEKHNGEKKDNKEKDNGEKKDNKEKVKQNG